MPGPGYKRHDLPGPSKVKNYKPKKVRRDARRLNQQYRAATKAATHAVVKYAAGEKANLPTLAQFRAAWPTLTETQRSRLAPAIIRRAAGGTTSPAIPKPLPAFLRQYAPKAFDEYAAVVGGGSPGAAPDRWRE